MSAWPYEQLIVYWTPLSWPLPLSLPFLTSLLTPEAVPASHWSGLTWSRALIGPHQVTPDRTTLATARGEEGDKRIFLLHTWTWKISLLFSLVYMYRFWVNYLCILLSERKYFLKARTKVETKTRWITILRWDFPIFGSHRCQAHPEKESELKQADRRILVNALNI